MKPQEYAVELKTNLGIVHALKLANYCKKVSGEHLEQSANILSFEERNQTHWFWVEVTGILNRLSGGASHGK